MQHYYLYFVDEKLCIYGLVLGHHCYSTGSECDITGSVTLWVSVALLAVSVALLAVSVALLAVSVALLAVSVALLAVSVTARSLPDLTDGGHLLISLATQRFPYILSPLPIGLQSLDL